MATYPVSPDFFESNDYLKIAATSTESAHLFSEKSHLMIDGKKRKTDNLQKMIELLDESMRKKVTIQRYKGLGEMSADQLWETTMDPDTRVLYQVKIDDAIEADQLFSVLMGDNVPPRKHFIETNAHLADNIDT